MKKLSILAALFIGFICMWMVSCEKKDAWDPKPAWYEDKDGDGKGNPEVFVYSDIQPVGYVSDNTDLNDEL